MLCTYCSAHCTKAGKQKSGTQKWFCKACRKYMQANYVYKSCSKNTNSWVTKLLCEGCGIRSIARVLTISINAVQRHIIKASKNVRKPLMAYRCNYEMDELRTYIGKKQKEIWIAYAIRSDSKEVAEFSVGLPAMPSAGRLSVVIRHEETAEKSEVLSPQVTAEYKQPYPADQRR